MTGGLGFVGGAVCCSFKHAGWEVLSLDNESRPSILDATALGYVNVPRGIEDPLVEDLLLGWKPDVIIHCAASTMIEEGENRKKQYFTNNVVNHGRFLASVLGSGATKLIYSGTAGVYAPSDRPVNEQSPCAPATWYGHTKKAAEDILSIVTRAGFLNVVVLRYFSVAGTAWGVYEKRAYDEHVITRLMKSARNGDKFVLNGSDHPTRDGSPVRDFVSIKDVARAHLKAAERLIGRDFSSPFVVINLGTGRGTTILDLRRAIEAVTGRTIALEQGPRRPQESSVMLCDYAEAQRLLDWVPKHELGEELRELWALLVGGQGA